MVCPPLRPPFPEEPLPPALPVVWPGLDPVVEFIVKPQPNRANSIANARRPAQIARMLGHGVTAAGAFMALAAGCSGDVIAMHRSDSDQ
jgi:hypothetical protein